MNVLISQLTNEMKVQNQQIETWFLTFDPLLATQLNNKKMHKFEIKKIVSFLSLNRFKDEEEIIISRDKYEGATLDQPALLLKKASREDSGAYSCRVTNAVGTGESENVAFVSVQCKSIRRFLTGCSCE